MATRRSPRLNRTKVDVPQSKDVPTKVAEKEAASPELIAHQHRLRKVQEQVQANTAKKRLTIRKGTYSHTPHNLSYKDECHPVDVSDLDNIISIDKEKREAHVEGQVDLWKLCTASLEHGLIPEVIPEFRSFTIAGLINGLGIQSSSHRYGLFGESVAEIELVLGNGDVVTCDEEHNHDLYYTMHGSYGSLAIVCAARIRLVPATPFVHSRYLHFTDIDEYVAAYTKELGQHDFHDGVVYGPSHFTLIVSNFVDRNDSKYSDLSVYHPMDEKHAGEEYYYQHVRYSKKRGLAEDLIPSLDYVFRSERGGYWVTECYADNALLTGTYLGRRTLDKIAEKQLAEHGFSDPFLSTEERERCVCLQDMGIELHRFKEGIQWVQQRLGVYPLWNCALRRRHHPGSEDGAFWDDPPASVKMDYLVDIGIYGEPTVQPFYNRKVMRELQKFVSHPSVWGVSYLSKEELRKTYKRDVYTKVRKKYHAEGALKDVEDKVVFFNPDKADQGPIPAWRLVRSWRSDPVFLIGFLTFLLCLVALGLFLVLWSGRQVYGVINTLL